MIRCRPGCRWRATLISFGPTVTDDFISPRAGASLVAALGLAPVGFVPNLVHPSSAGVLEAAEVVGWIESVGLNADGVDGAVHLVDEARELRRILLGLERTRRLHTMGLSAVVRSEDFRQRPGPCVVRSVSGVLSVDFVATPHTRAFVRRRLPCPGVEIRDGVPVVVDAEGR